MDAEGCVGGTERYMEFYLQGWVVTRISALDVDPWGFLVSKRTDERMNSRQKEGKGAISGTRL